MLITATELELLVKQKLDDFYDRRIKKLSGLNLHDTLKRKNPYLFRAIGVQEASEIVEMLLQAYMSSSDEGIFGDAFFEPLAKIVGEGTSADNIGIDLVKQTADTYTVIQIKSGPNWGNADQKRKLKDNFESAKQGFLAKQIKKQFKALLGQCYGHINSDPTDKRPYFTRSGQAFWEEITGDADFYLKIIHLMKDYPAKHRPDYQKAWSLAINRFTRDLLEEFSTPEGAIDWEKIVRLNSSQERPPKKPRQPHESSLRSHRQSTQQ